MSNFIPGHKIKKITDSKARELSIVYPQWSDAESLTNFCNQLSEEGGIFTAFNKEKFTLNSQIKYISNLFLEIERKKGITLFVKYENKIVGFAKISRFLNNMTRGMHRAEFSLYLSKDFRGTGIGYELSNTILDEIKKNIFDISLITLEVVEQNIPAITLYKKLGFQTVGLLPKSYSRNADYLGEVFMFKILQEQNISVKKV